MKQHILEHWIKLAQEIQEGVKSSQYTDDDWLLWRSRDCLTNLHGLIISLNAIKQHYSDLNT
jgi:hypothetical protein